MNEAVVKKLEKQFEDLRKLTQESHKRFVETCVWTNAKLYDVVCSDIDRKILEHEFEGFCETSWRDYEEILSENDCVIKHLNRTSKFCILHDELEHSDLKPEISLDEFVDEIAHRSETYNDLYYNNCFSEEDLEMTIDLWEGNGHDIRTIENRLENFKEELEQLDKYLESMRTCYEVLNNFKTNQIKEFKDYVSDQLSYEFDNLVNDVQQAGERVAELVASEVYEHTPVQQRLEEYLQFFRELYDNVLKSCDDWIAIVYDDNLKVTRPEYTFDALENKLEEVGQLVNNLQGRERDA